MSVFLRPNLARSLWTTPFVAGIVVFLTIIVRDLAGP